MSPVHFGAIHVLSSSASQRYQRKIWENAGIFDKNIVENGLSAPFNYLYTVTGDPEFKKEHPTWIEEELLDSRKVLITPSGDSYTGYSDMAEFREILKPIDELYRQEASEAIDLGLRNKKTGLSRVPFRMAAEILVQNRRKDPERPIHFVDDPTEAAYMSDRISSEELMKSWHSKK